MSNQSWIVKLKTIAMKIIVELKFRTRIGKLGFKTEDRSILENKIFPYFVSKEQFKKILFVGVDWYTYQYKFIFKEKEYWTIDKDESKKRFGADGHIVDSLNNLPKYFKNDYFDLIIVNGVFGWGLNKKSDIEKSFDNCYRCLRKDGFFILGWNDVQKAKPINLEKIDSLLKFKKIIFPPLSVNTFKTNTELKHTFNFYKK